ncbi:MAG TPA: hypothetical protein VMX33_13625 [bacterium]|nr:hypothetical protein [bacterium]
MSKNRQRGLLVVAIGAGAISGVAAQGLPISGAAVPASDQSPRSTAARFGISSSVDGWFPKALDPSAAISYVVGGTAQASYAPLPFIEALARFGAYSIQLDSNTSLLYAGGSAGVGFISRLFERVSVEVTGFAGLGKVPDYNNQSFGLYELGARLETSFRLSAAMTLGISAGYEKLANPNTGSFLDAITAGLRLKLAPAEMGRDRANVAFQKVETSSIFPVFRSWYDSSPLGTVTIRNNEDGPIDNIRVSFNAPEYMGGPRLCQVIPRIERGATATVPLYAIFDERVLSLTENSATSAEIDVEYSFLGSRRSTSQGLSLSLHHRNAMSWEDDRRAAAFVSPTDPGTLWFARYSTSIVRDRMRSELPPNLQYALGIFEALKLYGINYVIDPTSSYIEMSTNAAVVDYLQYPSQTLMYRGGDCDDLSILFCSMLESTGIATAFITIPGHIFMAYDMGMDEAEAREKFFDPGLLIFRDGHAWAPVEITMVKDGFVKAWRVGAKEWIDNDRAGTASFYPMHEAWQHYKPSGLQDAAARFAMPDEATTMKAFDAGVDRFVSREMEPVMAQYEKKLATAKTPETLNEYGMALARVGLFDSAWERFAEAAKDDYAWAWNNLANIAFVRKDYQLAYSYYEWTTTLLPGDPVAVLGMARCAYELDRYSEAQILYSGLKIEAPTLAARFGYLESAYGGTGRAWSMADRLAGSTWSRPGLSFVPPAPAATPAIAVAPPPATPPAPVEPVAQIVATPIPAETEQTTAPVPAEPAPTEPAAGIVAAPVEAVPVEAAPVAPPANIVAAPEQTAEAPRPVIEAVVQQADEPALAPVPVEPSPVEAAPVAPPAAIVVAPEQAAEPALAPVPAEPQPEIKTVVQPAPSATVLALATAKAQTQSSKAQDVGAKPKPAAPLAPPSVIDKPPEDVEIAAKAAESAIIAPPETVAPQTVAPEATTPESPVIQPPPAETVSPVVAPTPIVVPVPAPAPAESPSIIEPPPAAEPAPVPAMPVSEPVSEPVSPPPAIIVAAPQPAVEPSIEVPAASQPAAVVEPEPVPQEPAPTVVPATEPVAVVEVATSVTVAPAATPTIDLSGPLVSVASGSWKRTKQTASMIDPKAMYAKLVVATPGSAGPNAYEFKARATGTGWVGFGLHIHGRGTWKLAGYGGGDSILVWITSDPKANGDVAPRLQVYRSTGEVSMKLVASTRIDGSAFELRDYRVAYDPAAGTLAVFVDGKPVLHTSGLKNPAPIDYAVLRALDLAEFSDLSITPLSPGGPTAEITP